MRYVYYGNYAKYYHISRTELLRKGGISDEELGNFNMILPITDMIIKYIKAVFCDDIITIKTSEEDCTACSVCIDECSVEAIP